jgi:wyosine [tRNA(Phe)-imidazoG37] synthetase (radical SAM superfamily)
VTGALDDVKSKGRAVSRVLLAGPGEPTLHPRFEEIVSELLAVRDEVAPGIRVAVVSNSSTLDRASVRRALGQVDERYMQLDAGDDHTLRAMAGVPVAVAPMIEHLRDLRKVVVRSVFVADRVRRINNATEVAVGYWMERLSIIRPLEVHIATLRRPPAWPYLAPIPEEKLCEIAHRVEEAGLRAKVFPTRWTGTSGRTQQDEANPVLGCG